LIESHNKYQFETKVIWDTFKEWVSGSEIPYKPLSYESTQFGTISQKTITEILIEDFSAERPIVKTDKAELIFNKETFEGLKSKYDLDLTITVSQLESPEDLEDPEDIQDKGEVNSEGPEHGNPDSNTSKHEETDNKRGSGYGKDPPDPPDPPEEQPDFDAVQSELEEFG
jgi:hypothetical protein